MSEKSREFSASTELEAIEAGLSELGLTREQVEIVVIDPGSKGLFGIGAKPARVSITKIVETTPASSEEALAEILSIDDPQKSDQAVKPEIAKEDNCADEVLTEDTINATITVVKDLLERMRVKATVEGKIASQIDGSGDEVIYIDIKGEDLSYLIGRHSETLNALQYITSLIVGKQMGHWAPIVIDIQGYRERRERQIRQMAKRIAEQVANSGRKIALEPMPSTERRLVHLILRDDPNVTTESIGEEPNRKVIILPKQEQPA